MQIKPHQTIIEALRAVVVHGNTLSAPCGGNGTCGNCRVKIIAGDVTEPTAAELELLSEFERTSGVRLACQAKALGALRIRIPAESLSGAMETQIDGLQRDVPIDPAVRRLTVETAQSTLLNPVSTADQITQLLARTGAIHNPIWDFEVLKAVPPLVSETGTVTVTVSGGEITNYFDGADAPAAMGLAVDLGSTKIAAYLVDLTTGETLAADALMNPQIPYGEDIMSRLAFAVESEANRGLMAELLRDCVNDLADLTVTQAGCDVSHIEQVVIVGNTAMSHLFLEAPVEALGSAPYTAATVAAVELKARDVPLHAALGAELYVAPSIAGFVGGDHVAMILGLGIHESRKITLGLDIGTNTEIALKHGERLMCCSCASGPAFEGANITHGMRAVAGAISHAQPGENGGLRCVTIGNQAPLGLCGSGVVDSIAALRKAGVINALGLLDRDAHRVRVSAGGPEYVVVEKSGTGRDIVLTQKDIVAVQLAKAAIRTGVETLLGLVGLSASDVDEIYLAGAFGAHINIESAVAIGMLPDVPRDRIIQAGNAAGAGARLCLISMKERRAAERIARAVEYTELATAPGFSSTYAHSLNFP